VAKITVMIIDEQEFFRAGVRQVLSQQPDFEIIDCDPTQEPLELIEANLPDVALLGSDLASLSGL
jgi:two-component system response regulator DegU